MIVWQARCVTDSVAGRICGSVAGRMCDRDSVAGKMCDIHSVAGRMCDCGRQDVTDRQYCRQNVSHCGRQDV